MSTRTRTLTAVYLNLPNVVNPSRVVHIFKLHDVWKEAGSRNATLEQEDAFNQLRLACNCYIEEGERWEIRVVYDMARPKNPYALLEISKSVFSTENRMNRLNNKE